MGPSTLEQSHADALPDEANSDHEAGRATPDHADRRRFAHVQDPIVEGSRDG